MTENQKDPRNQQSVSKSHQEQTQDGKKKDETNPNNPKAIQDQQKNSHNGNQQRQNPGAQQDNQQRKDSTATKGETDIDVQDTEENEEGTAKKPNSGKPENQNPQQGNR